MTQQEIMSTLRQLRKQKKITLAQYAELTGLNLTNLSGVENCKRSISVGRLLRMAEALGAEVIVRVPEE